MNILRSATVLGKEHIPKDHTNFILAANHTSNFDPFFAGASVPKHNTAFLAKKELLEDDRTRLIMDGLGVISVDREKFEIASLRSAKEAIKHPDWCLGIFPEGTRVKDGKVSEPKKGIGLFARTLGIPVLPAGVVTSDARNSHIVVMYGPLIPYDGSDAETFTNTVMEEIERLKIEAAKHLPQQTR